MLCILIKQKKNQLQIKSHKSNLDALIGKKITIMVCLQDSNILQAKIAGQVWLVKVVDDERVTDGQQVIVVDIQGCHLKVAKMPYNEAL